MNSSSSAFDTSSFDTSSTDAGSAPTRHCIVCDGHMERCFIKHGYWIVECKLCGHRSTELEPQADHVTSVYADDYFEGGGAGYTNYLEEGENPQSSRAALRRRLVRRAGARVLRHFSLGLQWLARTRAV